MEKQNKDKVSFADLAPELRNRIYFYALVIPCQISLRITKKRKCQARIVAVYPLRLPRVSLLRTCKEIHREATPILYGANTFINYVHPRVFPAFQTKVGSSTNFIRKIKLHGDYAVEGFRRSIASLKQLQGLCELVFVLDQEVWFDDEEIVRILGGVMKTLAGRKGVQEAMGMLRIESEARRPSGEQLEVVVEIEGRVKELLREMLE